MKLFFVGGLGSVIKLARMNKFICSFHNEHARALLVWKDLQLTIAYQITTMTEIMNKTSQYKNLVSIITHRTSLPSLGRIYLHVTLLRWSEGLPTYAASSNQWLDDAWSVSESPNKQNTQVTFTLTYSPGISSPMCLFFLVFPSVLDHPLIIKLFN